MPSKTKTVQTTSSSTNRSAPWEPQQDFLTRGWNTAQGLLDQGAPDMTRATALAREAEPALRNAGNVASWLTTNGGLNRDASEYFTRATRGDYLTQNNPFFQGMVDQSIEAARPGVDAAFASAGRFGSGARANAFADAATRRATELGYADYGRERGFQNAAATSLNQFGLQDAGLRLGAAQAVPGLMAAPVDMEARASSLQNNSEWQNLLRYIQAIGSPIPGTTTSEGTQTQPVQQANPWMQAAGLGIAGLGAAGSLGMGAAGLGSLFSGASGLFGGGAAAASGAATGIPAGLGTIQPMGFLTR